MYAIMCCVENLFYVNLQFATINHIPIEMYSVRLVAHIFFKANMDMLI